MAKKKVGLYLGVDSLGGVIAHKKRLVSLAKFALSSLEEEAKVEDLNEEVKWEALINRTLREIGAETKEVNVTFTDRDFIYRSFEMPLMRKKEIETSVRYEIEKYIPFKLEQLKWDYSYIILPREKKINVSFIGIRENNFQRVREILTRLGLTPAVIEPSSLSLVRVLKLFKGFSRLSDFAVLDFTGSEGYLTFYCYDLPVFSRYLTISADEKGANREKLIEAVHLSFEYFKREFKSYALDRLIILADSRDELLVSDLKEELQLPVEMFSPYDLTGNVDSSIETVKALGVAAIDYCPYKFKPVFSRRDREEAAVSKLGGAEIILNSGTLSFLGVLCLAIMFIFGMVKHNDCLRKETALKKRSLEVVKPAELAGMSWDEISSITQEKRQAAVRLRKLKESFREISPLLEALGQACPKGLWLDSLQAHSAGGGLSAALKGYVFLGDDYRERRGVDDFVNRLNSIPGIRNLYGRAVLLNIKKVKVRDYELTSFTVELK